MLNNKNKLNLNNNNHNNKKHLEKINLIFKR